MAVYVDQIKEYPNTPLRWKRWSHMFADTTEELHLMASRIGLRREWFQDHDSRTYLHHYDVTPPRRLLALRYGAIGVCTKDYVRRVRRLHE